MTEIKICGLMSAEDARLLNELGADYGGVVMFFPKSHRSVEPNTAREIVDTLDFGIKSVAVVVSPTIEQLRIIENCGFDMIQIHGDMTDEVYNSARLPILKAFNVNDIDKLAKLTKLDKIIGFVFDAAQPGSGKTFDWSTLKELPRGKKLTILAGGLTPENVADAIAYLNPDAVDVSSGVENDTKTGKDRYKAKNFAAAVRAADNKASGKE